ncbi:MAG: hypothetical protein LBT47_02400, partial [Deltaproteobacteria bacterium]|nr:hypothetical protein [Deltaproteobacteria bacterium]
FQPTYELFESTLEFCQILCWQRIILEAGRQRPGLPLNSYDFFNYIGGYQPSRTLFPIKQQPLTIGLKETQRKSAVTNN